MMMKMITSHCCTWYMTTCMSSRSAQLSTWIILIALQLIMVLLEKYLYTKLLKISSNRKSYAVV